jgi:hypothetical protein
MNTGATSPEKILTKHITITGFKPTNPRIKINIY